MSCYASVGRHQRIILLRCGSIVTRRKVALAGTWRHPILSPSLSPPTAIASAPNHFFSGQASQEEEQSEDQKGSKLFPWRHAKHVIPRIEWELKVLSRDWRGRFFLNLWEKSAAVLMNYSVFVVLLTRQWRTELAENSSWAFASGIAALLSSTFKVPMDDIYSGNEEENEISFIYTTPYLNNNTDPGNSQDSPGSDSEPHLDTADNGNESSTKTPFSSEEEVEQLFEPSYVALFKSFYQKSHGALEDAATRRPLELTLTMKPIHSELWRLTCYPFLSREAVEEDPSVAKEYQEIIQLSHGGGGLQVFLKKLFAFNDKMLEERGKMQTTIMADVIIDCIETFEVKDLTNDKIIQGDGSERIVRHAVRMELDVAQMNNGDMVKSNWRIADVDDHLLESRWTPLLK